MQTGPRQCSAGEKMEKGISLEQKTKLMKALYPKLAVYVVPLHISVYVVPLAR